jgi:Asp-tRNA(Asn)/Glu-tRNA(Gln) amidotransferase A subunit family amidase
MVGEQLGISRSEVRDAFRKIDPEQWKQIRADADALANEWANARRRTDEARRRYADTVRRTSLLLTPEQITRTLTSRRSTGQ